MKRLALLPIAAYQRWVSPAFGRRCRFEPTCSAYAAQAVRRFGFWRGSLMALWRLLRCNPFSHGGVDELSDRRLFRDTPTRSERAAQHQWQTETSGPQLPPAGGSSGADLT